MYFFKNKSVDENDKLKALKTLRESLSVDINESLSDYDCNRFLKARDYDINKSSSMIDNWWKWRNSVLPGERSILPHETITQNDPKESVYRELLPHSNLGHDKEGCPIYWEKTGLISSRFHSIKKKLSEDDIFVRHIRQQELMIKRIDHINQNSQKKVEKQIIVFDLNHLSFSIDFMAMNVFRRVMSIDEACYPERLKTMYMINTPIFFTTIWAMIKPWINPVTVEKIKILGSNYYPILCEQIDSEQIPTEYGGKREPFYWTFPENFEY